MKISIDDVELLTINDTQKKVMQHTISAANLEDDLKRRIVWVLIYQRYDASFRDLKEEWMPKLTGRYPSIPTDNEQLAQLIFSQADYKDRDAKDIEDAIAREKLQEPETTGS
jgi:hypothetical protein